MAFPAIGKHLIKGYGEKPAPLMRRTEMERGPAKQARIGQRRPVRRPCRYRYTADEYETFLTWVDNEGAEAFFDWTDPRTGTVKQAQLVLGQYEAEIDKSGPDGAPLEWIVKIELEVYE
jgi:hypothetical protein